MWLLAKVKIKTADWSAWKSFALKRAKKRALDSFCFEIKFWNMWRLIGATYFSCLLCKVILCLLKHHLPEVLEDSYQKMDFQAIIIFSRSLLVSIEEKRKTIPHQPILSSFMHCYNHIQQDFFLKFFIVLYCIIYIFLSELHLFRKTTVGWRVLRLDDRTSGPSVLLLCIVLCIGLMLNSVAPESG